MPVNLFKDSSPTTWGFSDVRRRKGGMGSYILIQESQSSHSAPRMQFPRMRVPFGSSVPFQQAKEIERGRDVVVNKYNLDCDVTSQELIDWCTQVDDNNRRYILENKEIIFGTNSRQVNEHTINAFYKPIMTPPKENKYLPKFRFKITKDTNLYVFDRRNNTNSLMTDAMQIQPGYEVLPIGTANSIWIQPKECGITFNLTDAIVYPTDTVSGRYDDFNPAGFEGGTIPDLCEDKLNTGTSETGVYINPTSISDTVENVLKGYPEHGDTNTMDAFSSPAITC